MSVISVEGLTKSYGAFRAVGGVSFSVEEGEVLAVLGPNGAGKTTTVEILEGYRRRDGGEVSVLGVDPEHGGVDFRRRVGVVLQECAVEPYLTVREVLAMNASYYPAPRPIDEVIELVGLGSKVDARVKTLSGGQQRRLDVALGLVGDPELLFLDEPTTGFDPSARRQAWEIIRNLSALGKSVLLTTHYMDEAQALADRVVVVAAGLIVAEGTPESLGGRDRANAEIRFLLPRSVQPADLPEAMAVDANREVSLSTEEPTAVLARLTAWAVGLGVELEQLTVTRPSLEDVYLALTADRSEAGEPTGQAGGAR